jgi:hypothetical protein
VSARPRYEESAGWFGTRAVEVLQAAFGDERPAGVRGVHAAPRVIVEDGAPRYQTGPSASTSSGASTSRTAVTPAAQSGHLA